MGSHQKSSYYQLLVKLSGIPEALAEQELAPYFRDLDENPHNLSLDNLRKILAQYLNDMDKSMIEEEQKQAL